MKIYFMLLLCLLSFFTFNSGTIVTANDLIPVRVGIYENEPKIFTDEKGNASGFWPEIMEYIASQEGWEIEYVHGTWDECLQRLERNEIDIMPDVAYTEKRDELYDFSKEPVYISWSIVYAKKGADISTIPDLEGKKVAVMKGSINLEGPEGIKSLVSSSSVNCTFIEVDSYLEVFELLADGEADCGVVSKDFGHLNERDFDLEKTSIVFSPAYLYFAFPQESVKKPYLMDRIDYQIKQLKDDGDSIYYQSLEKWFVATHTEKHVIPGWIKWIFIGAGGLAVLLVGGNLILGSQVKSKTKELTKEIAEHKQSEEELRNSEEKLRIMFKTIGEGVTVTNLEGRIQEVNDAAVRLRGYSNKEELMGRNSLEILSPEEHAKATNKLNKVLTEGQSGLTEYTGLKKDGTSISIETISTLMRNSSGDPMGIITITRDITKRKEAEDKLRQSEEKLSKIFRSIPDFVSITSMDNGRFIDVNDSFLQTMGFTLDEIIGQSVVDLGLYATPKDRDKLIGITKENKRARNVEIDFRTKSGQIRTGLFSTEIIDLLGETCVITVVQDITERKQTEEALRQSEEKLRVMFETVGDGIVLVDLQGNILKANEKTAHMVGYSKEELTGLSGFKIVSPEDFTRAFEDSIKGLAERFEGRKEYTLVRKDRTEFTAEVTASFIKDASNDPVAIVCVLRDVTERKRAEETLRKSEEKLRITFQSMAEGIVLTDQEGNILETNEATVYMYRSNNKEEIIGRNVSEFISPKDHARSEKDFETIRREGYIGTREYTLSRKDGTEYPGEVNVALLRDQSGNPFGAVSIIRDITERKRAEELVRRSYDVQSVINRILNLVLQQTSLEELLRHALNIVLSVSWLSLESKGAIFLVEDNSGFMVMNAQTGLEQSIQQRCASVPIGTCLCGKTALTQDVHLADYLDELHEIRYEGIVPHAHYCIPIVSGSNMLGVMSLYLKEARQRDPLSEDFLRTVSEVLANIISHKKMEKRVAEYEELTRLKSNILSTVSHELRTPLASIKGYATMMLDYNKKLNHKDKRLCLEAIDRSSSRLAELIDHLLDMSRLEAGIFRLSKQSSRIVNLIREAVTEAQLRAPEHKITAELEDELPVLNVDGGRIRQVLDNLIENATRYSDRGTEVIVRAKLEDENIEINVSDHGRGIPATDLEKVFDPMYRLEARLGQDPHGLGLGLPLCKALVEAHGGRIYIESILNQGTTVHFTLPLTEPEGAKA